MIAVRQQPGSTLLEAEVMAFAGLVLESGHFFITERWGGESQTSTTMAIEMFLILLLTFKVKMGARHLIYVLVPMNIYLMITSVLYLIGVEPQLFHSISFMLSLTGLVEYGREYGKLSRSKKREILKTTHVGQAGFEQFGTSIDPQKR